MSDVALLTEAEITEQERVIILVKAHNLHLAPWEGIERYIVTIRDLQAKCGYRDSRLADAAAQIEALRAEVERGRESLGVARPTKSERLAAARAAKEGR